MVFAFVALECKVVEIVAIGYLVDLVIQLVRTRKAGQLICNHYVRISAASGLAAAIPNPGIGFSPIRIHINAIFPSALDLKRQIWRIYFEVIFVIEVPYSYDDGTLGQLQLGRPVIEIKKGHTRFRIHAYRSRASLQFRSRILVSPQIVARREWPIGNCFHPIALPARLERNRSHRIAESRYAAWRILRRPLRLRRRSLILRGRFLRDESERRLQHQQHPCQDNSNYRDFARLHWLMFLASPSNGTAYIV